MTTDLVVLGAGGFGRETLDVIEASNRAHGSVELNVLGVVDDDPSERNLERLRARGYRHLGSVEDVLAAVPCTRFVIGVGSPTAKAALGAAFQAAGWRAVSVVHPGAVLGSRVRIGDGVVICGGAQVSTNADLGSHVHINPNATIGHDAVVGEFTSINPGAIISGEVEVRARSLIGAGAVILQGLVIGERAVVGASACVTKDVAPDSVVVGTPARPLERGVR